MASLKEIKNRITSVKSTLKITSAMKMVASAKLHRAQSAIENMLPYQKKINDILTNFLSSLDAPLQTPYAIEREVKSVAVLVYSSNVSLCGAFNANVIKRFVEVVNRYKHLPKENIKVYPVGRKIEEAVKKMGFEPQGSYQHLSDKPSYEKAVELADVIERAYVLGEVDRVELIYHHYKTVSSQELLDLTYLPIDLKRMEKEAQESDENVEEKRKRVRSQGNYIVEPSAAEFISSLLPTVLKFKIFTSVLDSSASEHAARTMAMQIASDNANDLIQDLTQQYNKSRQQAITNELLDIIGGSMK